MHLVATLPDPAEDDPAVVHAADALAAADDAALATRGHLLLDELVVAARRAGARTVRVAAQPSGPGARAAAEGSGFTCTRQLLELRRSLPLDEGATVPVRPFRPGRDDAAWLSVNNRAFAWHPEQGGWDADRLRRELAQPWVDLDGFVVHETDGHLDAFCWTKVHPADADGPERGEIYVVAADPDAQGRGLGRQLVLAGLDRLADAGVGTATLWVEDDNVPALALYERLGFTEHTRAQIFEHTADDEAQPSAGPR